MKNTGITLQKTVAMSVGGAHLVTEHGINIDFLKNLNSLVRHHVGLGTKFLLVAGGGKTARDYRDAGAATVQALKNEDLDWLGIHASRLNGHLLRTIFEDIAHHRMVENYYHHLENFKEKVAIGAGWKPGHSTDYCAAHFALDNNVKTLINISNIDYVYTADPKHDPHAKPILHMTYNELESLVGSSWLPGMNAPFDPIALQFARLHKIRVIVVNGANFDNLDDLLSGRDFVGTIVE